MIRSKGQKVYNSKCEEVTNWLDRQNSDEENNTEESESESTRENTPVASTSQNNPVEVQTTTESITPMNLNPNLHITEKRTINSLVTMKKLIPITKMKKNKAKRKPVEIKKANSKLLTSTQCRKLVKENHEKKAAKRLKKAEVAKKEEKLLQRRRKKQKKESDTENSQKASKKENT